MRIIWNWRQVLQKTWSVRLIGLSIFFSGVEAAVPYLDGVLPISKTLFAWLAFGSVVAAGIARFIAQRGLLEP